MTDRETLLANILENPADDTARLVFADMLRESEDPEDQERGRFLWAGVTTATYHNEDLIEDHLFYTSKAVNPRLSELRYIEATPGLWQHEQIKIIGTHTPLCIAEIGTDDVEQTDK